MNYTQEAIKRAEKGGYKQFNSPRKGYIELNQAFLDPLFWSCLGKVEEWSKENISTFYDKNGHVFDVSMPRWQFEWHRLIDHLAEGHNIESFFKNLLSN